MLRPGGQQGLVVAVPALQQLARAQRREVLGMPTLQTYEACRSAPAEQCVVAHLLGAVSRFIIRQTQTLLKLDEVLGFGADLRRRWMTRYRVCARRWRKT